MNDNEILGEVGFRFSSRFSQLIGRNLISNPIVAVSELVKNSYDADADNIKVEFSNVDQADSSLRITDDGEGMSYDDIVNKWMVVGTDNKIQNPFTPKGRRKLGEKGIGRFSVERLAHKVTIISKQAGNDYAITYTIDWDKYEMATGEFSDQLHQIRKVPDKKDRKGTSISLIGLRDVWTQERLLDLKKELEILKPININDYSYKKYKLPGDEVKIELIAPEIAKAKKLIQKNFVSYSQAHLFGEIKADGSATVKVNIKSNISMSKTEVNETYEFNPGEINTLCGPVTYEAFIFLKDKRLYKSLSVDKKDMDDYLTAFCGVKIYRDGFRILPFGDPDNDWLELNAKRTSSPEHRIGTQNAIGIVYITRDNNPGLQDVLSRENMYDTAEFDALKNFVNIAFDKYTELQLSARKKAERKVQEEGKKALTDAQKSVSEFTQQVDTFKKVATPIIQTDDNQVDLSAVVSISEQIAKAVSAAESSLTKIKNAYGYYKKQSDFRSRETQIYRNIATLGISAAMFGHEALNYTVDSKAIVNNLIADYSEIIKATDGLQEELLDLQKDLILIDEKADFYRNYLNKEKQDCSQNVNLIIALDNLLEQHKSAFSAIGVIPVINISGKKEDYYTWAYWGDIDSVFTNLITNAYKALKKFAGEKMLKFTFELVDSMYVIHSENTGKPIEPENREKIFEPLFSTYSDGTGLGLTIIQDTLQLYKGSITLCNDYPNTRFLINIPHIDAPEEVDE